jgi:hypothetical protein
MAAYKGCGANEIVCADCKKTSKFDHYILGRKSAFCVDCAEIRLTRNFGAPKLAQYLAKDPSFLAYCCGFVTNATVEKQYLS